MPEKYDIVILGSGPGGYVAAIRAAQLDMKVSLVEEKSSLGGTCMNIGCIPSKALLHASELFSLMKESAQYGIISSEVKPNIKIMQDNKQKTIQTLGSGIEFLMKKNKITVYHGMGILTGSQEVTVHADKKTTLKASRILLATGGKPQEIPGIPYDGKYIVSSTEALDFTSVPKRLLVIGGGAIGLEIGSIWSRLGSKVTILEGTAEVLPGWDPQIAKQARKLLESQGITFLLNAQAKSIKREKSSIKIALANEKANALEADKVLLAVGRKPVHSFLDKNNNTLDFRFTNNGKQLEVNDDYQTNVPSIYAIGDLIPGPMLAHKASEEGIVAIERMNGIAARVNYSLIPKVVYTHPEIASVGLQESELKEKNIKYKKSEAKFSANGRALAMGNSAGRIKILADSNTDTVLGIHIIGPNASELANMAVVAMEFSASSEDLVRMVYAHPTLSEILKEASEGIEGHSIHGG